MSWTDENDYRPLLRRWLDSLADRFRAFVHHAVHGFFEFFLYLLAWPGRAITDWWERFRRVDPWQSFLNLIFGLPSLVIACGFLGVYLTAISMKSLVILHRYDREAKRASLINDHRTASMYYARMRQIDPYSALPSLELAKHYDRIGMERQALALMRQLTPPSQVGDPDAHFWLAEYLLRRNLDAGSRELVRVHLERVIQARPEDAPAHAALGKLDLEAGSLRSAREHLDLAASKDVRFGIERARVLVSQGSIEEARAQAASLELHFLQLLKLDPDDRDSRLRLAETQLLLGKFPTAINVLREGSQFKADREFRRLQSRVYVAWGLSKPEGGNDRWTLWEEAFRFEPTDRGLLRAMISSLESGGNEASRFVSMLERTREDPQAGSAADFILGFLSLQGKNPRAAEVHFERAAQRHPHADRVLAELLIEGPFAQPVALLWFDRGVKHWPQSVELKRGRAKHLLLMNRYQDCVDQMNEIAEQCDHDPTFHSVLADAYTKLGNNRLATEHRRLASPWLEFARKESN